jgi:hypothetical protein
MPEAILALAVIHPMLEAIHLAVAVVAVSKHKHFKEW